MKKLVVGYGKLGRAWNLDINDASTVGGDIDVVRGLQRLSHAVGSVTLVGRCSKHVPAALGYYPKNVRNPWVGDGAWGMGVKLGTGNYKQPGIVEAYIETFIKIVRKERFDALVLWIGQHGSVTRSIPQIGTDWPDQQLTVPLVQTAIYCSYLIELCNARGIEPVLLVPDPRNTLKLREFKRPFNFPLLAQWTGERELKHEQFDAWPSAAALKRYGPGRREESVWVSTARYEYAAVELLAIDEPRRIKFNTQHDRAGDFGIIVNENRKEVSQPRLPLLRDWVLERWPHAEVYGTWSPESQKALGRQIAPVPVTQMYDTLRRFRATSTLPASGSTWATAKPWECFAAGTVCFFHPRYDAQDNVLLHERYNTGPANRAELRELHEFLRVGDRDALWQRVDALRKSPKLHARIIALQRRHFERAFKTWGRGIDPVLDAIRVRV